MVLLAPMAVGLLVGTFHFALLQSIPKVTPILLINGLALLIAICVGWLNKAHKLPSKQSVFMILFCTFCLFVILGASWAYVQAKITLKGSLPDWVWENAGRVVIAGDVVGVPTPFDKLGQFDLNLRQICNDTRCEKLNSNFRIRCRFYKPLAAIHANQAVRLLVTLKKGHRLANPGSVDIEKYLFLEKIRAQAIVHQLLSQETKKSISLDAFRERLTLKIKEVLPNHQFVGEILALTLGIKSDLRNEDKAIFLNTGTSHLMAISGLHVGLMASLWFWFGKFLARLSPKLLLTLPASTVGAYSALFGAIFYAMMAGFALPTQRALIMIWVVMLGWICKMKFRSWDLLNLALIGVLLYDPFASLSVGFWLSFGAVFILLYALSDHPISSPQSRIIKWFAPQWAVFVGLIPLTAVFFNFIPVISPLANVIAIPWMSMVVVPLSVIGAMVLLVSTSIGAKILILADISMQGLWPILKFMAGLRFKLHFYPVSPWALGLAVIGVIWLLAPKGWPKKPIGLFCLFPLFFWHPPSLEEGKLRFYLLEVGQGLSAVIQTKNHIVLYDVGPTFGPNHSAGDRVILPFLKTLGIEVIDKIILSHGDSDHTGGLNAIMSEMPVNQILTSEPERIPHKAIHCDVNQSFEFDNALFKILTLEKDHPEKSNNRSCVLQIVLGDKKILLTGDIEKKVEHQLVRRYGKKLASDILIAPHHGSESSSSFEFIESVSPKYVLFPTGKDNPWHFPNPRVLERYQAVGAKLLNTTETGAIEFILFDNKISEPEYWRAKSQRFWHSEP